MSAPADLPVVVIVGRPNVGKSTLFNRLVGKKLALVDDRPGVTRDRREGVGHLLGMQFRIVDTAGAADLGAGGERLRLTQHRLDGQLVLVRQLEAIGAEQLDAVVLIGVVAGRDHHADVCAQFAGQQGNRRSRHRPQQDHIHAHAGKTGNQGVFQHVAR